MLCVSLASGSISRGDQMASSRRAVRGSWIEFWRVGPIPIERSSNCRTQGSNQTRIKPGGAQTMGKCAAPTKLCDNQAQCREQLTMRVDQPGGSIGRSRRGGLTPRDESIAAVRVEHDSNRTSSSLINFKYQIIVFCRYLCFIVDLSMRAMTREFDSRTSGNHCISSYSCADRRYAL